MEAQMEQTEHGWTVVDADAGVWSFEYSFDGKGRANGLAMRGVDGSVVVVSPPCGLPDDAVRDLEALGEVRGLVANNGFHYLGQAEWRERFPDARSFATAGAAARIAKKAAAAPRFDDLGEVAPLLGDDRAVRAEPATGARESYAWVDTADGAVWYVSDILNNMHEFSGPWLVKKLWQWTGSGPGYRVFHLALMATAKHKRTLLTQMLEDMRAHPPRVVVFGHGPSLARDGLADETYALLEAAL